MNRLERIALLATAISSPVAIGALAVSIFQLADSTRALERQEERYLTSKLERVYEHTAVFLGDEERVQAIAFDIVDLATERELTQFDSNTLWRLYLESTPEPAPKEGFLEALFWAKASGLFVHSQEVVDMEDWSDLSINPLLLLVVEN